MRMSRDFSCTNGDLRDAIDHELIDVKEERAGSKAAADAIEACGGTGSITEELLGAAVERILAAQSARWRA